VIEIEREKSKERNGGAYVCRGTGVAGKNGEAVLGIIVDTLLELRLI